MNVARPFNYLSLFTGGGGLDLGLHCAVRNARPVLFVERESFACACLEARMAEGSLATAPIHTDVASLSVRSFRGLVDAVIGGSPCQGMSLAGNRLGLVHDARSALFFEMVRLIEECQPRFVYWENVLGAKKYLPAVFAEFERIGYAGKATIVRASDVGAPHQRARIFVLARRVADAEGERIRSESDGGGGPASIARSALRGGDLADSSGTRREESQEPGTDYRDAGEVGGGGVESEREGFHLADASSSEVGFEPGWSSRPSWAGTPIAGFVGEDVADGGGGGFSAVRQAQHHHCGDAPRYDDDGCGAELADAGGGRFESGSAITSGFRPEQSIAGGGGRQFPPGPDGDWSSIPARLFPAQSRVRRMADGLAGELDPAVAQAALIEVEAALRAQDCWADRLRMLGNGVVPRQAEAAFRFLYAAITRSTSGA